MHFSFILLCTFILKCLCLNLLGKPINMPMKAPVPKALVGKMKKSVNNVAELVFPI